MNYGQVKRDALNKIFSETIAGEPIASTYNNQADYEKAIPGYVNDAMMYIATTVKKIPAIVRLDDLFVEEGDGYNVYQLPQDCYKIMNGGLILPFPKNPERIVSERYGQYRVYGGDQLWLPKNAPRGLQLEYYRYPIQLPEDPDDNMSLDNTPDTHGPIAFYVASQLVMYDDPFRYAALYNEWETRLGRITEPVLTENTKVYDVYGFGNSFDYGWWG